MISETLSNHSSNNNQEFNKLINAKLLINNLRQNKVLIIITAIILFFARPLVQIIGLMGYYNANGHIYETVDAYAKRVAENFGLIIPGAAFVLALFIGVSVTSYMHDRKAAIFYSSIPVKRLNLFATQYLSGLLYFLPAFFVSYILSVIIMPFRDAVIINTEYYLGALFFFLLIYSFIILCSNIGGTAMNSLLAAIYLCAVLPALFTTILSFFDNMYRFTSMYGVMESSFYDILLYPVIIYFPQVFMANDNLTVLDCVLMFIFAAAMTCLAYLFNRLTKTENAEKPFYFEKFLTIFKYSVLAILVVASSMLFYMAANSKFMFMIVGIAVGGFISFLLVNLIIYKNIREVFRGTKQFIILALCISLAAGVMSVDIFGIDKYIPEYSKVDTVYFDMWNHNIDYDFSHESRQLNAYNYSKRIEVKNPEAINLVNDVFTAAFKSDTTQSAYGTGHYYQDYNGSYPLRSVSGVIYYKLKNGRIWAKKLYSYNLSFKTQEDLNDFETAVNNFGRSRGFKQAYYYPVTDMNIMSEQLDYASNFTVTLKNGERIVLSKSFSHAEMQSLIAVLNEDIEASDIMNDSWQYELSINFYRSAAGSNSYLNLMMNERNFKKTISLLYNHANQLK